MRKQFYSSYIYIYIYICIYIYIYGRRKIINLVHRPCPGRRVADKVDNTLYMPPCSAQAWCTRLTTPCFVFAGVYSTFCWCEPLLLLVPVSSLQVPCFTFYWCEPLFLLAPISSLLVPCFTFCWREPLLLLVCVSSFASEQSLHLGSLQARCF